MSDGELDALDERALRKASQAERLQDYDVDDFVPVANKSSQNKSASINFQLPSRKLDLAPKFSQRTANELAKSNDDRQGPRRQGRDDRATTEQVLDPRTRMILFKMLDRKFLERIDGCISTGKEANVYYALSGDGSTPLAIKVYKTSILVFKDRDRYVSGDQRFKSYGRRNPRKMVQLWAEKEMRNLKRLQSIGLNVPNPVLLKSHVLAMDFIGIDGWPAPRLKDAKLSDKRLNILYKECAFAMRRIYQQGRLVHGDLSEYNMLYMKKKLYIIDVSQSVDHDHPRALDFLRTDCKNVTAFFAKKKVATKSIKGLFYFIVSKGIDSDHEDEEFEDLSENTTDDEVFLGTHIPRSLMEVENYDGMILELSRVELSSMEVHHEAVLELLPDASETGNDDDDSDDDDDDDDGGDGGDESDSSSEYEFVDEETFRYLKHHKDGVFRVKWATPDERKSNKKAVKEANRIKRLSKIKKKDKKRRLKNAKSSKKR